MSTTSDLLTHGEVLCFLHIPKTAGLSLTDFIKSQFAPFESNSTTDFSDFIKTPQEEIAKYKFIAGHFPYNVSDFVQRKLVYITVLRDPVERTISHYAHIRRNPAHHGYNAAKSQSLLEFARDPYAQNLYANLQARLIGLDTILVETTANISQGSYQAGDFQEQGEAYSPNGSFDRTLLERAQERISKFAFVGITERFDESLALLCATFGWTTPATSKVINFGTNRPHDDEVSQEVIDIIRENNKVDATLYDTCKHVFVERYNQLARNQGENMSLSIDFDLDTITMMQRKIDLLQRANNQLGEELELMRNSFGGRVDKGIKAAGRKLIPQGSKRESIYLKFRGR